ncbi:MAG: dTDP-4-dehydrorhamnose reductase [bacterium]|nr:dTDP-4-dehydrorhamnose reductase [bacterium]
MKIAIIGANGMLGADLCEILRGNKKFEVVPFYGPVSEGIGHRAKGIEQDKEVIIDITNQIETEAEIVKSKPDVIIHTAAYTDVDGCELNKEKAYLINSTGTQNVALAAKKSGAFLIYISTDYVFNGEGKRPYRENDTPDPMSIYGKTKLDGEKFVQNILEEWAIIRISWLFGKNGKNFIKAILNQMAKSQILKVVDDQIGSPTYTKDLSKGINYFIQKGCETGIYHLTNQGFCSWFEFAKKIVELTGNAGKITVEPINSLQLTRPAKRPHNSVLENYAWKSKGYPLLQNWEDALKEYLKEEKK